VPDLYSASERESCEDGGQNHRRNLSRDHDAMTVVPVSNDASQWSDQEDR